MMLNLIFPTLLLLAKLLYQTALSDALYTEHVNVFIGTERLKSGASGGNVFPGTLSNVYAILLPNK